MTRPLHDRVSLAPFAAEWRGYSSGALWRDAQAGLTVAVFAVPQAMAYAILAGLPPVHGLYAGIVMSIVAALFGASPHINTGPTNSAALLTAAALGPFLHAANAPGLLELVFLFSLLCGIIRAAMGALRLGWLVRFVPESAFLGFLVGAGVLIALGQTHHLLGVPASNAPSFPARLWQVLARAGEANLWAVAIGLATLVLMLALDRWARRFPVALGVMAAATGAAYFLGPASGLRLVRDIAPIPAGLPALQLQPINPALIDDLMPGALAVAVIGLIEAVSIGQALALKHRSQLNFNQEFFGQGLGQIVGALFQGFPGSGSFSRTALIEGSGGQTRAANIFFGLFTALALLILPRALEAIPVAALAGLLLFVGWKLVDFSAMRRVWRTSRADAAVLAVTFATTVFVKIELGFFAGLVAAMAFFLNNARDLQMYELVPQADGRFEERPYSGHGAHEKSDVVALSLHGDLFFGWRTRCARG
jgi:SulP family sulfate permease